MLSSGCRGGALCVAPVHMLYCLASKQSAAAGWGTHGASPTGSVTEALVGIAGHGAGVRGMAFHEGGDFLASAALDGTARVWHAEGGACQQTLRRGLRHEPQIVT